MFEMWIVNSNVGLSGCKHMAVWNQLSINYLSDDLAKIIDFTWQFDLVAQMIWMQVFGGVFKLFYKICMCMLSHYHSWGHNPFHWHVSAGRLLSSYNLDLVSESLLTENLWSRLSWCLSIVVPRAAWSDDFFVMLTFLFPTLVMAGAIIAINHLIFYTPLEWIMPFSVCWSWTQGSFCLKKKKESDTKTFEVTYIL